jgi:nucleotide-binding universal stress UspA family protein
LKQENPMYHKILVPLDGSKRAERILPHVESLATTYGARIILLRVVQIVVVGDGYKNIQYEESMAANRRTFKKAEVYLDEVAGRFKKNGLKVEEITQTGPVVETILEKAAEKAVDLIAMTSHGRTGLSRVFYGSIAAGVIHRVDRPLLVIRSRQDE